MSISVVIPCYNERPERLGRTIASVLGTAPGADVVVVDDGSTTPVEPMPWVRLLTLPENRGPAGALNAGYAAAKHDLIARVDVGDVWFADPKRRQIEFASGVPACFSVSHDELGERATAVGADWSARIYMENQFQASTTIVHRRVWERCPFDESLRWADDWDWHMRVQFHVGWSFFDAVTGTATCWTDGHNKRRVDPAREAQKVACAAKAARRGIEYRLRVRNGKWRGNAQWAARNGGGL